jgi:hypothetical protein
MKHLIVTLIVLTVYGFSLVYKDGINKKAAQKEPVTLYTLRAEKGTPIKTIKVKEGTIQNYFQISGFILKDGSITTEIAREVASRVSIGDYVFIKIGEKKYTGQITNLSKSQRVMTGLYPVTLKFKGLPVDTIGSLKVAFVPNRTTKNTIILPREAISYRQEEPRVYKVDADNKIRIEKVKIGTANSDNVSVTMGVTEGEKVVISDQRDLSNNERVFEVK